MEEDFALVQDAVEPVTQAIPETDILMTSPEWSTYALSHLVEDEYKDGFPTVDGLRRIAKLLLGPILITDTRCVKAPNTNDWAATVEHRVTFLWQRNDVLQFREVTFSGCADMFAIGNPNVFAKALSASAESKAESRALRKALGLRNVYTNEELENGDSDKSNISNEKANDTQFTAMDIVGKKNNINVSALLTNMGLDKDNLSKSDAQKVLGRLSEFSNKKVDVLPEMVGFVSNWRS